MRASIPTVTIVGRPNVGKSTLFNRMAGARKSIVIDVPNATRDWLDSVCRSKSGEFRLIDTAGISGSDAAEYSAELRRRTGELLGQSDLVVFIVDTRLGLHPVDNEIASWLRSRIGAGQVILALNKSEGKSEEDAALEFHVLGLESMIPISARRGDNMGVLSAEIDSRLGFVGGEGEKCTSDPLNLTVVGRPNVGKSSLINSIIGHSRLVVSEKAGTTRDCVEVAFESGGREYLFSDTAGLRRKARISEQVEQASASRTIDGINRAEVVLWVLDATASITAQDRKIMSLVAKVGKAMVAVVNKWDLIGESSRRKVKRSFVRELETYCSSAIAVTSATSRSFKAGRVLAMAEKAHHDATQSFTTRQLMMALGEIVRHKAPPLAGKIRPKMRYAHQGGKNPVSIVIHGNALDRIGSDYQRYLIKAFSRQLGMDSALPQIVFRSSSNPYA